MTLDLILIAAPWIALAIGYVVSREIEYRRWGRLAIKAFTTEPIANLKPPTVLELNRPTWTEDA